DLLLDLLELRLHLLEVVPVVQVADPPGQSGQYQRGGRSAEGASLDQSAATLHLGVDFREPRLGKHDLEEEPRDEVASATRMLRGKEHALEREISGERSNHTVDGVAFLGSTGEVDAAEKRPGLELVGSECVLGEVNEALAQEGELLGEGVKERPPARL